MNNMDTEISSWDFMNMVYDMIDNEYNGYIPCMNKSTTIEV